MWNLSGAAIAAALAAVALLRSLAPAGFYDGEVYGMSPAAHRRYALAGLAFLAVFAVSFALRSEAAAPLELGALVLVAIVYFTSFLRGAPDRYE